MPDDLEAARHEMTPLETSRSDFYGILNEWKRGNISADEMVEALLTHEAAARADAEALFQRGDFTLAGGAHSSWKIECDALTQNDWATLAWMAQEQGPAFSRVVGVPRGGLPFAEALELYTADGPTLVVDDVLTTGASILRVMADHPDSVGLVAFARGPLPKGVRALWSLGADEEARIEALKEALRDFMKQHPCGTLKLCAPNTAAVATLAADSAEQVK